MLTRDNFKDFVLSLPNKYKQQVLLDDDNEYIYVTFSSYGNIITFELTNDNEGEYQDIINSDEWAGNEYLLRTDEVQEILKKNIDYIHSYCELYGFSWNISNNDTIQNLYIKHLQDDFYMRNQCSLKESAYSYYCRVIYPDKFKKNIDGIDLITDYDQYLEYMREK